MSAPKQTAKTRQTWARILGARGGKVGGAERARRLTPAQRSDIARKAAQARWSKRGAK